MRRTHSRDATSSLPTVPCVSTTSAVLTVPTVGDVTSSWILAVSTRCLLPAWHRVVPWPASGQLLRLQRRLHHPTDLVHMRCSPDVLQWPRLFTTTSSVLAVPTVPHCFSATLALTTATVALATAT